MNVLQQLGELGLIPVVKIDQASDAPGLAGALKQLYLEACQKAGEEPDGDLLSRFD